MATSQTLASQAGAQILARGGSAMDAAIAANAVLGVVEPESCGMGGDLFAIYCDAKTGKLTAINASGWAAKGQTIELLKCAWGLKEMPQEGIQSVTVPGAVSGWASLHKRFGKLPWSELFQPAIYFAEHGFPVTEMIGEAWKNGRSQAGERRERQARVPARWARAGGGRDVQESGDGGGVPAARGRRARRRSTKARSPRRC